jgi:hypothetical protein
VEKILRKTTESETAVILHDCVYIYIHDDSVVECWW